MNFLGTIYETALRHFDTRHYNDIILRPKNVINAGTVPLGSKAAIYLIFPKSGLLQSHLIALRYMIDNGYSPIVVSNLPLSAHDLDQLRPLTYRTLQRENFGYDFGGYREGILVFQDQIKTLDHLALFNDSVWFPVVENCTWLAEAERADQDLMGAVCHVDIGHEEWRKMLPQLEGQFDGNPSNFSSTEEQRSWFEEFADRLRNYRMPPKIVLAIRQYLREGKSRNNSILFHYCSFALLIGKNILRDPEFYTFWQNLKIVDDWLKTIFRGEIGFTQWVLDKEFSHDSIVNPRNIADNVLDLDDIRLTHHLQKIAPVGVSRSLFEYYHQILGSQNDPTALNKTGKRIFFTSLLRSGNIAYIAPYYLFHEHQFPFFKKKNFSFSTHGHKIALDMIADMPAAIKSEMTDLIQKNTESELAGKAAKISGKRKIFGIWVGLPQLWH